MTPPELPPEIPAEVPDGLLERAQCHAARAGRAMLGICGAPGSGKTTLALALAAAVPGAVLVGMDGFHLAQEELARLGIAARKGAPDTFDAHGYLHLLQRLRANIDPVVYAPRFHRSLEEPVAGSVPVPRECPLVVTEGNYLLLAREPWTRVRAVLDECWYLAPPEDLRLRRLVARHERYGRSHAEALDRSHGSDQRNAELVAATAARADRTVRL